MSSPQGIWTFRYELILRLWYVAFCSWKDVERHGECMNIWANVLSAERRIWSSLRICRAHASSLHELDHLRPLILLGYRIKFSLCATRLTGRKLVSMWIIIPDPWRLSWIISKASHTAHCLAFNETRLFELDVHRLAWFLCLFSSDWKFMWRWDSSWQLYDG